MTAETAPTSIKYEFMRAESREVKLYEANVLDCDSRPL